MKKLLFLAVCLCMIGRLAFAEIPCSCSKADCVCYIQLYDEGRAVDAIQNALIAQGYLESRDDASVFDERTMQAVIRFQQAHGLSPTGTMNDETLTLLLWGMLPEELDVAEGESSRLVVWIPTDGGIRHHDLSSCSGMLDPRLVTQRNALMMDLLHCGRCKPDGYQSNKK